MTFLSISPNVLYMMKAKPQEISSQKNYCPHVCVIATVLLHLCSSPHVLLFEKYSLNSPSLYLSVTLSHKSAVELWFRSALLGAHLKLSSAWWRTVHSQHIHCVSLIEHCSELVYCLHSSCGRIKKNKKKKKCTYSVALKLDKARTRNIRQFLCDHNTSCNFWLKHFIIFLISFSSNRHPSIHPSTRFFKPLIQFKV